MISTGNGGMLVRWDLTDLRHPLPASPTQVESRTIVSAAISPDASTIAFGSIDDSTVLIDARTGQRRDVLRQLATPPLTTAFSPDGRFLSSGALDGTTVLWDARPTPVDTTPLPSRAPVLVSAASPDGHVFATGSRDGTIALYDVSGGLPHLVTSFDGGGVVDGLAIDPRGTTLAVATGSTVTPWAIGGAGAPTRRRSGAPLGPGGIETIAFADDGGTIIAGGQGLGLWRWVWATPGSSAQLVDGRPVFAVAVSPDGHDVVTSNPVVNTLDVWDVGTGTHVRSLPNGHATSAVDAMTFAGPSLVITGGRDGAVVLTDIDPAADRQEVGRLQALTIAIGEDVRQGYVFAVAVTRDQRLLAVGGSDGTTSLWDLSAPDRPRPLGVRFTSETGNSTALTFVDDDRSLVSATFAGPAEIVSTGPVTDLRVHAIETACARAGGPLPETDWRGLGGDSPYQDTCATK